MHRTRGPALASASVIVPVMGLWKACEGKPKYDQLRGYFYSMQNQGGKPSVLQSFPQTTTFTISLTTQSNFHAMPFQSSVNSEQESDIVASGTNSLVSSYVTVQVVRLPSPAALGWDAEEEEEE